jgi:L-fuculose-phosphate aldolase
MTSEFEARRRIVEIGRRLWERGFVASNDGNLSVRLADGRIVVTPTGVSKGFLDPRELVVVDARGTRLSGTLRPTSELRMHLFAYDRRSDVGAVVHAHPPKATGFSAAGVSLGQCVLPEVVLSLGDVPTAPYATPSTEEVARSIERFIDGYSAMLLRRHGVLTLGADIDEAYFRMETVEHVAEISLVARSLGGALPLTDEEMRKLLRVREKLGVTTAARCASCGGCVAGRREQPAGAAAPPPGGRSPSAADVREADAAVVEEVIRRVRNTLGSS